MGELQKKERAELRKRMFAIAIPIAISGLVTQAQMLIDAAFLGHYEVKLADGSVLGGGEFLSAVGNVFFPYIVSLAFIWSITTGTVVLVSQRLGAKDPEAAKRYAEASIKFNSILSIGIYLIWAAMAPVIFKILGVRDPILGLSIQYIRTMSLELFYLGAGTTMGAIFQGLGKTRPEMWTGILRSVLNIVLDWVMIFGHLGCPELGVAGAGLATSLSGLISTVAFVFIAFRARDLPFRPSVRSIMKAPFKPYRDVLKVGLPSSVEDSMWNFGNLMLAAFLNALSAEAVGIYRLVIQIELTPVFFYFGIARAVTTLVGNKTGERDIEGAKRIGKRATMDVLFFCLFFTAAFLAFPKAIIGIFTDRKDLVAISAPFLMIASLTMIPKCINIISGNGIRGYGDTMWMLVTQIFGLAFVIGVSWTLIFPLGLGMYGLFITLFLDETIRGIINTIRFYRGERSIFHKGLVGEQVKAA